MDTGPSMLSIIACYQIATKSPHTLNQPNIHIILEAPVQISHKQVFQLFLQLQRYIFQQFNTQLNTIEVDHQYAFVRMYVNDVVINNVMVHGGFGVDMLFKHLSIGLNLPQLRGEGKKKGGKKTS
jgi:hypothetical protein